MAFDYREQVKRRIAGKLLHMVESGKIPNDWPALANELREPGLSDDKLREIANECLSAMPKGSVEFR
jgi:hypothetical protein